MKRFHFVLLLIGALLLMLAPAALSAQQSSSDDTCPALVQQALDAADQLCTGTNRNEACYGNVLADAEARENVTNFNFDSAGDIVNVSDIASLTLSGMNLETGDWGVALMRLQANIPDTLPGQNVTFLLFGDVQITNAAQGDFSPMQAFYFSSGVGEPACQEAPQDGILIQTPEGVAEIALNINGVNVQLGSTAYIQAAAPDEDAEETEGTLAINLLEGGALVEFDGVEQTVPAGMRVTVPIGADLLATGAPSDPEPYEVSTFGALPTRLLEREIEITGLEMSDSGAGFSGITPLSGTWLYSNQRPTAEGSCPAAISLAFDYIPLITETTEIDWSAGFTAENMQRVTELAWQEEGTEVPVDYVVTSPEPGVVVMSYTITADEEAIAFDQYYRIISETFIQINWAYEVFPGCTVNYSATLEYQG